MSDMSEIKTKAELVTRLKSARAALEVALAKVPPERMTEVGVVEGWSVKDILAHITMWLSRTITAMFQAERGQKPSLGVSNEAANDWAKINAKDFAEQKDRPLDRVMADFRGAHTQILKRLDVWQDEAALFDKQRYPSLSGDSLADLIHGNGDEHDDEHRVHIEKWLIDRRER